MTHKTISQTTWCPRVKVLYDSHVINKRVRELGRQIASDYKDKNLHVVGVLRGSFMFYADLVREIHLPITCDFIGASSYCNEHVSSGKVEVTMAIKENSIEGRDILLVEDIVDTGLTIHSLLESLAGHNPKSLKVCSLLSKPIKRKIQVPVDYVGFEVDDQFVVGYGLDDGGVYRNLPYVGVL